MENKEKTEEKGINTVISETEESVARVLNDSKLPPTVIALILKGILMQVDLLCRQAIADENKTEGDA